MAIASSYACALRTRNGGRGEGCLRNAWTQAEQTIWSVGRTVTVSEKWHGVRYSNGTDLTCAELHCRLLDSLKRRLLQFIRTELSRTMALLQTVIVYTIGCIVGLYISIRLAIRYICNPSAFPVKKRETPPACLTDPQHGNHGYLSLKVSTHW